MRKLRYQDFLRDLASGSQYGVFVDDTGSPGLHSTPSGLHPQRKTWVGVVVPPHQMPDVLVQLRKSIEVLASALGAREFHFADIYAGRGDFNESVLQIRLNIFEFFVHIFQLYKFPIFVQTLDPNSLPEIRARADWGDKLGTFNFTKQEDLALFFLLIWVQEYIKKDRTDRLTRARVFVDEGYKKNGTAICAPPWDSVFADGLICFAQSSSILPLQLADFAAFSLNRTQLILGKEKLNSLDKTLLEILSPIAWNYQNIEKRRVRTWNPPE